MVVIGRRARPRLDLKARPPRVEGYFSQIPLPPEGGPLHVNAAIGPGLCKHARSPLHAPVPMAPSAPAPAQAILPLQDAALTFAWLPSQARGPWQLFFAMAPWFCRPASPPTQLCSPTMPSFCWHALMPRQACLEIWPEFAKQAESPPAPSQAALNAQTDSMPESPPAPAQAPSPTAPVFAWQAPSPMQASLAQPPAFTRHALGPWQAPTPTAPVFAWHIKESVGWPSRKWHAFLLMLPALSKQAKSPTHAFVPSPPELPVQASVPIQLPAGGLGGPAIAGAGRSRTTRPRVHSRAIRARD